MALSGDDKMPVSEDLKQEVEERFANILSQALAMGLTANDLASLKSVQNLRTVSNRDRTLFLKSFASRWTRRILYLVGTFIVALVLLWTFEWPASRMELVSYWFGIDVEDLEQQRCLVEIESSTILNLVRPPVDCSMCRDLKTVDRVSKITPEVFESKYAYSGRPVVITDAMTNWTAVKDFSFEFFKGIYAEDSPVLTMSESNCQFFPYKSDFHNLNEVFQMSESRAKMTDGSEPWYIGWSNCDSSAANVLRSYYTRPYFLPDGAESSKTDWIFMGSPGYGANMHIDNVVNPSWQAQVTGTKLWTLEPPSECYFDCQSHFEVEVQPGEIIVLDTNKWFHSTLITGKEMSITIGSEYD